MSALFLDSKKPLHTCTADNCDGCSVTGKLVCHFNSRQLFLFLLMALPVFLLAGFIIHQFNPFLLVPWILFIVLYFGLIEIRVMCSHCPHYAEPEIRSLKCWANYGSPKFWKYRPGPMYLMETIIFYSGFIIILVPPVVLAIRAENFILLAIYIVLTIVWKQALQMLYCNHCINFACPFNRIDSETRNVFFDRNPAVRKAWNK
jgi:hypothetical protein